MAKRICVLILPGVLAMCALAQTTSTEVLGTVTDSSGATMPGARVTLLRTATGERRQAVTDSDGIIRSR